MLYYLICSWRSREALSEKKLVAHEHYAAKYFCCRGPIVDIQKALSKKGHKRLFNEFQTDFKGSHPPLKNFSNLSFHGIRPFHHPDYR